MSDERIKVTVVGAESTVKGLEKRQAALGRARMKALRLSSEIVLRRATENVSGRILRVQTGTLRKRLSYIILAEQGISRIGSPTIYAPVHEYGGTVQHPGGTYYFFNERTGTAVFVSHKTARSIAAKAALRGLRGVSATDAFLPQTRPHAIPIPARPWLRPALTDSRGDIEAVFNREAKAALAGEGATP